MDGLTVEQAVVYVVRGPGETFELEVTPRFIPAGSPPSSEGIPGGKVRSVDGVISTRSQGATAAAWGNLLKKQPFGQWTLAIFADAAARPRLLAGGVEDVLFGLTYSGQAPAWPV